MLMMEIKMMLGMIMYCMEDLPYILLCKTEEDKAEYLKNLYRETYLDDIKERRNIKNGQLLNDILDVLSVTNWFSITNADETYKYYKC